MKSKIELENYKCDKSLFESEIDEVKETLKGHYSNIFNNQNQNQTIENYIEKY